VREAYFHECICEDNLKPKCLYDAYQKEDYKRLRKIVKTGKSIDSETCLKRPLLEDCFAFGKDKETFSVLKSLGADPNYVNEKEKTLLQMAAYAGNTVSIRQALDWGMDINFPPEPPTRDINVNYDSESEKNRKGLAPVFECLLGTNTRKDSQSNACLFLKFLDTNGANLQQRTTDGTTILHLAAALFFLQVMDFIVFQLGFDVNSKDDRGHTALYHVYCGQMKIPCDDTNVIDQFVERGTNIKESHILMALTTMRLRDCLLYRFISRLGG
jgi:ankyrin repeat protein